MKYQIKFTFIQKCWRLSDCFIHTQNTHKCNKNYRQVAKLNITYFLILPFLMFRLFHMAPLVVVFILVVDFWILQEPIAMICPFSIRKIPLTSMNLT